MSVILLAVFSESQYAFIQEPMVDAARNGDLATVSRLLDRGADVDGESDDQGGTALVGAAAEGHADIVLLLLRRGANPNKATSYFGRSDQTPLMVATGHPDIVAILKKAGAKR